MNKKVDNFLWFVVFMVAAYFLGKHGYILWSCLSACVAGNTLTVTPEREAKFKADIEATNRRHEEFMVKMDNANRESEERIRKWGWKA